MRAHRGVEIERSPGGWYVAFIPDHGYLKADTLVGIREMISSALGKRTGTTSRGRGWEQTTNHLGHKQWFSKGGRLVITTDGWSGYSLDKNSGFRSDRVGYFDTLSAAKTAAKKVTVTASRRARHQAHADRVSRRRGPRRNARTGRFTRRS